MSAPVQSEPICAEQIRVRGLVQGVGFRPTVFRVARQHGVRGQVCNDGEGVLIHAWAEASALEAFVVALGQECPPLATIDSIQRAPAPSASAQAVEDIPESFEIVATAPSAVRTFVSPDAATCPACLAECLDPFSRRYRYPFTNCTHCGPRLSIVTGIPYDRAQTSMADFALCRDCAREYGDPGDRRFHAQPNACHRCGPRAQLVRADGRALCVTALTQLDDVDAACTLLQRGEIVAVKGIGGFHLACDATRADTVERLRRLKGRDHKPFALMAANLEVVRRYAAPSVREAALLESAAAPIVLLDRTGPETLPASVAPGQNTLGFLLPYTPLHHLLLRRLRGPIVLTSGNHSEEPQCTSDEQARARLGAISPYLLLHDRPITTRVDDSVVRVMAGGERVLRRGRGYAPAPLRLPPGFRQPSPTLALGGELKNTFCLLAGEHAVISQHIGDLANAATFADYEHNLELYARLFAHAPERIVIDAHPEYLSSKLGCARAERDGLALSRVQHHHAHLAACLADNAWPLDAGRVLGIVLDGLGYAPGEEGGAGELWGGEFLLGDYRSFERLATFKPVALLGGERAMHEPWRNTYAHLMAELGWPAFKLNFEALELCRFLESKPRASLEAMLASSTLAPRASSCGRLFDAVAAALGICRESVSYEGQAAIELEASVDAEALRCEGDDLAYPFAMPRLGGKGLPYLEPLAMWQALLGDLHLGTPVGVIAARFHKGLAQALAKMAGELCRRDALADVRTVALSGGVLQNRTLLEQLVNRLEQRGFRVLLQREIPPNDSGLALGQALVDAARQQR